jgi:hypothetical protein
MCGVVSDKNKTYRGEMGRKHDNKYPAVSMYIVIENKSMLRRARCEGKRVPGECRVWANPFTIYHHMRPLQLRRRSLHLPTSFFYLSSPSG